MKNKVKFSIIIPVHNAAEYILDALESLEIQQFMNFECLIIDDHSTDESLKIIETFKRRKLFFLVQVYETPFDKWGPGAARNVGLSHANGEYLLFLDADDKFKDKYVLDKINNTIIQYPNAEIILLGHCKVWYNQKEEAIKEKKYVPKNKYTSKHYQIGRNNEGIIWSCCWKKKLFQEHNIQFPVNTVWEDLIPKLLLFSYASSENIKCCAYITHQYNIRLGKSVGTTPTFSKLKALIKIYKRCNNLVKEGKLDEKYQKDIKRRMLQFPILLGWILNRAFLFKIYDLKNFLRKIKIFII